MGAHARDAQLNGTVRPWVCRVNPPR